MTISVQFHPALQAESRNHDPARRIVTLSKAELDGRSVAFGIPYRFYVGTHNENHAFIEQKRVFDSLGEDLGETGQGRESLESKV